MVVRTFPSRKPQASSAAIALISLPNTGSLPLPVLENGEKLITAFLARGDARRFSPEGIQEITSIEAGRLILPSNLSGPHVLLFFISSDTGQQVKRAALNAEGFVLGHYNRDQYV